MFRYEHGGYRWSGGCPCSGGPAWSIPVSREEFVEDLEDYKTDLEAEIAALEKRIKAFKEKAE